MMRGHRSMVIAMTVSAVMAAPGAAPAAPTKDRAGLQQLLDAIVDAGTVGALAETRGPDGRWRGASGVAELGTTRAVPVDGRVRAGSITKTFVATVVLQLVGESRLRLDDTVESWLPGVVPGGRRITVRQLLNHTSGLFDYVQTLPMPPDPEFLSNRLRTWTPAELVQRAVAHPPTSGDPGSAYAYSNTNYLLLGLIIEKVTGRAYGKEVERRLIGPLGLRGTSMPGTSPGIPGPHPHGYVPALRDGEVVLTDFTRANPSVFGAAGEIISTTRDLNEFFAALLGGRLLPPHLLAAMKTPGVAGGSYGLGLAWRDTPCGTRVYGNDGGTLTYQTWSFSTQDRRRQVTVAVTPDLRADYAVVFAAVDTLLDKALCASPDHTRRHPAG
ncbi:serine hydrolase domain-containing protein [Actinoplanes friuliensis]|uniref:Beta-lactamase n=1 Tax=Actinoplanes friuliensis DSM 7358 TaxID=1246995 RepID=U5VVZ8_9ACTN|nr:serine hydrolase domain-containing protein [Actinoplanes friuliensis]AGZ41143.1 beta-lactamase [Actinoplanes friuliensis DSM 7358]